MKIGQSAILSLGQRSTHTYVIGQPGTGKSKAIETWFMQDALAGRGVGVIDPHGDLFTNLLAQISRHPKTWHRVVIVDPCSPDWVVGINPLETIDGSSLERVSLFMTDIMAKIWGLQIGHTPRLLWLMNNTFIALAEAGLGLPDLPQFLLDPSFRESQLLRVENHLARTYFEQEYPRNPMAAHQWATPLLNKIGPLLFDRDVRPMLSARPTLNFRNVMDHSKILLVNLPKGVLGEGTSALLGAFIVAQIQKSALARANQTFRKPFYLYLDEFQNYTTSNIVDILAESRKYALSLTLAHQYLSQLPPQIREAVLNTAGMMVSFRIGHDDAVRISKDLFSQKAGPGTNIGLQVHHNGSWPQVKLHQQHRRSQSDPALLLTQLHNREFYAKRRGVRSATKHKTFTVPGPSFTPARQEDINRLVALSGQIYGKNKSLISTTNETNQVSQRTSSGFWDR